jgi:hypothetical protein
LSASLGLCGLSIMTMPSVVVTKPWLQPRISVSTNTFFVSCRMRSPQEIPVARLAEGAGGSRE